MSNVVFLMLSSFLVASGQPHSTVFRNQIETMPVKLEKAIRIIGEQSFDIHIEGGVLATASGKFHYNDSGRKQMIRMLYKMTGSDQPTTSDIKQIVYSNDSANGALAFVVFRFGIVVLAPDNIDEDKHIRGIESGDGYEIFRHENAIFLSTNGSMVASTPATLLIVTPRDMIAISYKGRFGNDARLLEKPNITGSGFPEIVLLRDPVLRDQRGIIKLEINLDSFSIAGVDN